MRLQANRVELRVNLASADEARRKNLVAGNLAPGLVVALGWEEDFKLHLMTKARLGQRPPDQALKLAMAGPVGGFGKLDWRTTPSGATVWLFRGGNPWVATLLLRIGDWLATTIPDPVDPMLGVLVAVPTRSTLYVHVIDSHPALLEAAAWMAAHAAAGHATTRENPREADVAEIVPPAEPLSPELYWWKPGALRHLPSRVDLDADTVEVAPTEPFVAEVLKPLGKYLR